MRLEIIWSEFSESQLDEIFEHYKENGSLNVAIKLIDGILNAPEILRNTPCIGQKEPHLNERETEYRYLVYKSFKIIYSVGQEFSAIKIADVFDTRQLPDKIKRME